MRRCRGPLAGELLPHHGVWRGPSLRCGAHKKNAPLLCLCPPHTHGRGFSPAPGGRGGAPGFSPSLGPPRSGAGGGGQHQLLCLGGSTHRSSPLLMKRPPAGLHGSAPSTSLDEATCGSPRIGTLDETDRPLPPPRTPAPLPSPCYSATTPRRGPHPPSTTTRLPARRRCPPRPSSSRPSADRCLHTTCTRSTPRAWAPLPTIKGRPQQRGVRHHATSSPPRPSHPLHPSGPSSMAVMHLAHTASSGGACHVQQQPWACRGIW